MENNSLPLLINNSDNQVVGMFLATKKRRSEKTAETYLGVLKDFFAFQSYKPIQSITYSDMVAYSEYLAQPNLNRKPVILSVSTQNTKIATVKSLFKYAMKIGYLQLNPAEPLETQRVDSKIAQRIISNEDLKKLLSAAHNLGLTHTLILCFFSCTGCRESELAGLMWKDFFLAPGGECCTRLHGKGHKDRIVKIPHILWKIIVKYRTEKGLSAEINPNSKSSFMINRDGNPYRARSIYNMIKEIVTQAGVNKDISPHWLRHTFATEVAKDPNSNIWRLQYDLGHANLTTTQNYVHIAQGMEETSVDHLGYMDLMENDMQNFLEEI